MMRDSRSSFHQLTDDAFADLLKKHKQPVGLKAALKESVGVAGKPPASRKGALKHGNPGWFMLPLQWNAHRNRPI